MAQLRPRVAIIGAGAGGIAMGIRLRRAGHRDFRIFERSDGVGGTWRDNSYPGAACDVPSHLYSFSFEPNPGWTRTYATQPEILAYLEHCTDAHGLRPHLRLGTTIAEARWSDAAREWELRAADGACFHADVLVSALGMLNVPFTPPIPGAERFEGRAFHSARWDHDLDLTGRRVAVVGTGATAIQLVPAIAPRVEALTVFQRSPTWIRPKIDPEYRDEDRRRFARVPLAARRHRLQSWWSYERNARFGIDDPQTIAGTAMARSYLERKVADPDLRAALTPDHPVGCKRPLLSRDWYPALQQDHVRVVTAPVAAITRTGLRTTDGEEHAADTIVWSTGFVANQYLSSVEIFGRGGRRLHDDWRDGAEAYLGLTVSGYPNFFMLYGPNTNGVSSILFMHEAQAHYVAGALAFMRRRGRTALDVRRSVMERYNARIQRRLRGTVWSADCSNYFRTAAGKIVTQLPYRASEYWLRTRRFDSWRYATEAR
jgi:cation diffusion facilitator CzcD-associated flavoprotein CzcO